LSCERAADRRRPPQSAEPRKGKTKCREPCRHAGRRTRFEHRIRPGGGLSNGRLQYYGHMPFCNELKRMCTECSTIYREGSLDSGPVADHPSMKQAAHEGNASNVARSAAARTVRIRVRTCPAPPAIAAGLTAFRLALRGQRDVAPSTIRCASRRTMNPSRQGAQIVTERRTIDRQSIRELRKGRWVR